MVALYFDDHFDQEREFPYRTSWVVGSGPTRQVQSVEYPVLTGLMMWMSARVASAEATLTRGILPPALPVTVYFCCIAVFLAAAWLYVVNAIVSLASGGPRHALLVALSPLVVAQIFTNFDALAVGFATGGLLAWSRRQPQPLLSGALLGLGAAAKLYPLLLLVPITALCLRTGALRAAIRAVAGAVGSWVIVHAPIAIL